MAEVGRGGAVLRLGSLSSKAHWLGVPEREITWSGSSSTTSSSFVSCSGASEPLKWYGVLGGTGGPPAEVGFCCSFEDVSGLMAVVEGRLVKNALVGLSIWSNSMPFSPENRNEGVRILKYELRPFISVVFLARLHTRIVFFLPFFPILHQNIIPRPMH